MLRTPRAIEKTGDDRPATSLRAFVWRMTGWHQVWVCLLAVVAATLILVPLDLQRRIVDGPISDRNFDGLIRLGLIYMGVVLLHRVVKFVQLAWQAWLAESAVLYVRSHLIGLFRDRDPEDRRAGEAVSIVNAEVDRLGGFAGQAPSQACANVALLVGILAYMLWLSPAIAGVSVALVVPQIALTPLIQKRLNRLLDQRLTMLRGLGEDLSGETVEATGGRLHRIFRNRIASQVLKILMKSVLNTLNLLAPLAVLGWGGYLVIQGETTVGVLVAFVSGFDRLSNPIRELLTFYRTAEHARVQHESIARWMGGITDHGPARLSKAGADG